MIPEGCVCGWQWDDPNQRLFRSTIDEACQADHGAVTPHLQAFAGVATVGAAGISTGPEPPADQASEDIEQEANPDGMD